MSSKILKGTIELGNKIKLRRHELGLTIEEAASLAGVGIKTWCRYEAGESIRKDKITGICRTLKWNAISDNINDFEDFDINKYKNSKMWSQELADKLGIASAISFIIGSDILLDYIEQDLEELSSKPKGTHIGELSSSWVSDILPQQFLTEYNYDFLYYFRNILIRYRDQARFSKTFIAHSVVEELILYLVMEESGLLMESILPHLKKDLAKHYFEWDEWPFELFGDMDLITFLYSDCYIEKGHPYHFARWRENQFYCNHRD